jgi:hypothetical protein
MLYQLYFSITSISQNVSRTQLCTEMYGALCLRINKSKLCILLQIYKGKFKIEGRKEAVFRLECWNMKCTCLCT